MKSDRNQPFGWTEVRSNFLRVLGVRDVVRGVQRMPMLPRNSAGPLRTSYSPVCSHQSEFSRDIHEAACSQMRSLEVLEDPTRTNYLSWGHLEQTGAPEQ